MSSIMIPTVEAALRCPDDYVVTFDMLGWSLTHADSDDTDVATALTEAEALAIVAAAKKARGY